MLSEKVGGDLEGVGGKDWIESFVYAVGGDDALAS